MPLKKQKTKHQARLEFAAGGVVFQRAEKGPKLAFLFDPYNRWAFAKGHIEKGESPADAALRETQEEMGIHGLRMIAPLGKIDIWFYERYRHGKRVRGPKVLIHKFIYYFLLQAPRGALSKPERTEKIQGIRWVSLDKARVTAGYKNIIPVLLRALKIIRDQS